MLRPALDHVRSRAFAGKRRPFSNGNHCIRGAHDCRQSRLVEWSVR